MKDTKYRLKKDTPFYKKGTEFCEDWNHKGELLNDDCIVVADLNELDNPDEWFEPVSDEWPQKDAPFWSISADGSSFQDIWLNLHIDSARMAIGNAFKTKEAADRFVDYLKATAVVRQDKGVIDLQGIREEYEATPENKYDEFCVYTVAFNLYLRKLVVIDADEYVSANAIWFDTMEHAQASLDKHQDEWKTIANYDWSRE